MLLLHESKTLVQVGFRVLIPRTLKPFRIETVVFGRFRVDFIRDGQNLRFRALNLGFTLLLGLLWHLGTDKFKGFPLRICQRSVSLGSRFIRIRNCDFLLDTIVLCADGMYGLVFREGFGLPVGRVYPLAELFLVHLSDGSKALPAGGIVREVGCTGLLCGCKSVHDFVLVEFARFRVDLIDHEDVPLCGVIGQEHVNLVAIHTLGHADIAVGVVHGDRPRIALCVRTTAHGTFRVLDADVVAVDSDMALAVVPCLLLCVCRIEIHLCLSSCYLLSDIIFPGSVCFIGFFIIFAHRNGNGIVRRRYGRRGSGSILHQPVGTTASGFLFIHRLESKGFSPVSDFFQIIDIPVRILLCIDYYLITFFVSIGRQLN